MSRSAMQTRFTTKPEPLELSASTAEPQFKVTGVQIAAQVSKREFDIDQGRMAAPGTQCWFYVQIEFPWQINTGAPDSDAVITDGDKYYLVNISLLSPKRRKCRLDFNSAARQLIDDGITEFLKEM